MHPLFPSVSSGRDYISEDGSAEDGTADNVHAAEDGPIAGEEPPADEDSAAPSSQPGGLPEGGPNDNRLTPSSGHGPSYGATMPA